MTMTEKLDLLMQERDLTKADLARDAGIPYMTIVNFYVKGTENVKRSTLLKLSRFFDVTVDFLAVDEETRRKYPSGTPLAESITELPDSFTKPRINSVVHGKDLFSAENIACYDEVPPNVKCDFTMQFVGDSMKKVHIDDGDIVYVRLTTEVKSHEIAAVVIDGRLTLRRVYRNASQLVLLAENPAYAPLVVHSTGGVRIVGKAVAFLNPDALGA